MGLVLLCCPPKVARAPLVFPVFSGLIMTDRFRMCTTEMKQADAKSKTRLSLSVHVQSHGNGQQVTYADV